MRPPTTRASMARGRVRSRTASSSLTAMRSAWNVRLAGLPPVRRVAPDARGGDPAGEPLLAVVAQDAAQLPDVGGGQQVRGAAAAGGVHPHVQGGVTGVGEAALLLVQLEGGDAEVEEDAGDAV